MNIYYHTPSSIVMGEEGELFVMQYSYKHSRFTYTVAKAGEEPGVEGVSSYPLSCLSRLRYATVTL